MQLSGRTQFQAERTASAKALSLGCPWIIPVGSWWGWHGRNSQLAHEGVSLLNSNPA